MHNFSVGIPIYNEEFNIVKLLKSIRKQKLDEYNLVSIILYNDGSTDGTNLKILELIKQEKWFEHKIIYFLSNKNKGKACGLNRIFERCNEEFIVLIDSDMVLDNINTFSVLLNPLVNDRFIGLTNGWYRILNKKNCLSQVLNFSLDILREIGKKSHYM